jgi:hypothetical protein
MKKLIIILIIGAMTSSCGSGSVDISKIDSPCACAEAGVKLMKIILPYKDQMKGLKRDATEDFLKENGLEDVYNQMNALEKKCKGDLSPRKAESDCSALSEFKDLLGEMK